MLQPNREVRLSRLKPAGCGALDQFKTVALTIISALFLTGCLATGDKIAVTELHNKKSITISADVHRATSTKSPTVILLHGCGGPEYPHMKEWVTNLNSWGYNAVIPNVIQARGASQICNKPYRVVTAEQASVDAYEVAKWIKEQEWATDKVALIGFSFGAWATLHAAEPGYVERNYTHAPFVAGIAFYPYCSPHLSTGRKPVMPLQIHIGSVDEWTPANLCRDLVRNWSMEDEYFEYKGASHGFDMLGVSTFSLPDMGGKRHWLAYDLQATILSRARTKAMLDNAFK